MLSLSNVSAHQAENYYEKDDYYSHDLSSKEQARWIGKGATSLGLSSSFQSQEFRALLHGQDLQGNPLHAKRIDPANHRAATDYTFSAPKSISIAALIQGDTRVIEAHDRAVKVALEIMEDRYTQTRISTDEGRKKLKTGNLVAAVFRHETSRERDPQLHSHCVVINATKLPDGSWRSMSNEAAIAHQKLLGQIYQNELAFQLRQCGYEIEARPNGQFELKGYDQKVLDIYSNRTQAIQAQLEKWEQTQGKELTPAQRKAATLKTRKNKVKDVDREALLQHWESELKTKNLQLPTVPDNQSTLIEGEHNAIVAVNAGVNHCSERDSLFRRSQVERFALEHHLGEQSFHDLQRAFNYDEELILAELEPERYTTQVAINRELDMIQMMRSGQEKYSEIAPIDKLSQFAQHLTLTNEQRHALELSITTRDQVIAWQGIAGAGKTYALSCLGEFAFAQGYTVQGLAPSAAAATLLSEETGIPTDTVASWLYSKNEITRLHQTPQIWIVDEAGLLSARDCHALLKRAADENVRILFVGDTKQLSSVEAGQPFRLMQQHGITIAHLQESRRQKDKNLRAAVNAISKGDMELGFCYLEQADAIREVETSKDRISAIVKDYLSLTPIQRANTLIVATTNAERCSITQGIRAGLQAEGRLAADIFTLTSLKPRDFTISQAKYDKQYELGDVIVPTQNYYKQQLVKGQQYTVIAIDETMNRLNVEMTNGQRIELAPSKCDHKTIYKTELIPIAPGDRMRWTRNDRDLHRRNGQEFTIVKIDPQGKAVIRDMNGKTALIDLSGRQFADYGIVSTTYASQGKTADHVLAALDRATGKESFHVAVSRTKHELAIYTTDATELRKLAARSQANENVSDYLDLFTYKKHHAENQTWTIETQSDAATARNDSANRGISIGSRAGECLATTLQRNLRTEASTSNLEQSFDAFDRANWVAGIDVNAVVNAVAGFVERRTIRRNEEAITTAFESIAANLRQLERISQTFAERDRTLAKAVNPAKPKSSINLNAVAAATPMTLETALQLSSEDWLKLTPRQQITLVKAAQRHQSSEPQGYTQAEQWVGQRTQLQQQLITAQARERLAEATVKKIQAQGVRSLFNPFGATQIEQYNARSKLSDAKENRQQIETELKRINDRQCERDQQDAVRQAWYRTHLTSFSGCSNVIAKT